MDKFKSIVSSAINDIISDIYITGGHPMVTRRLGNIQFHDKITWSHKEVDNLVKTLLNERQLDALRQRKSLDYAISLSGARLRINIFETLRGLSLAIRILPGHIPTVDDLNLHPSLNEISKLKSGLVLNCGPTGMGKTTTIAAIINEINETRQAHIITLENPIEYRFQSKKSFIQQRELGTHMTSFAQGLIDVLRENPDVVVVGELREPETMKLTLNAAESGHLVIATLHASTPEEAVYRLCNSVQIESQSEIRLQLASSLSWLITQQLVYLEKNGFRVPLLNIVRGTQSVKNVIRENKLYQLESIVQIGKNDGMYNSERYLNEYLAFRQNFTSPLHTFRPSPEQLSDIAYQSPLMESKYHPTPIRKRLPETKEEPAVVRSESRSSNFEHILTIDDDEPLSELIGKIPEK
jgi:pilus retraction protein PilT